MRMQYKGLNPNETYCCTQKDVKCIFGDADIEAIFGLYNMSRNEKENSEKYRPNKKCKDIIVAKMVVRKSGTIRFGLTLGSYLSFFILNKNDFTEKHYQSFKTDVLPRLQFLFENHKSNDNISQETFSVIVGLRDNSFNLYESLSE